MTISIDHSSLPTDNTNNNSIPKDTSLDEKDFDLENNPSQLLRTKSTITLGKCSTINSPCQENGVLDSKVSKLSFSIYLLCAFCTVGSFPFVAFNLLSVLLFKFPSILLEKHKFYLSMFVAIDQIISILTSALW